jgi:predicted CXXCH cytochrome family protein
MRPGRRCVKEAAVALAAALQLAAPPCLNAQTLPTSEDCRGCHVTLPDQRLSAPAVAYDEDVHAEVGFGCLACHGSGGMDRLSPAEGFLAAPVRRAIPDMCGRCHSDAVFMRQFAPSMRVDQVTEYWTSVHGQRLMELDDPDVATCIDCHVPHSIRPPDDPASSVHPANVVATCGRCHSDPERMGGRDIATNQVEEYRTSVHGRLLFDEGDLSAPACNDCHGNHGAAPPGIASVRNVCGQCHAVMADYFDQSAHGEIFNASDLAGCGTCHDHHAVQEVSEATLYARAEDVCASCHVPPDTLANQFEAIGAVLDTLLVAERAALAVLEDAENRGMEVSQAIFELGDIGNVRTRARSAIHTFRVGPVRQEVAAGLAIAERAAERGEEALAEYEFRRLGLGVSSAVILLLIIALLLKIREAEGRMEEMVARVESLYGQTLVPGAEWAASHEQLRLAASALMLEVCHADGALSEPERIHLERLARQRFGLQRAEAEELIRLAENARGGSGQLDQLARLLAAELTLEQKWVLLDELWQLVGVDGEASPDEVAFMEKLADMLGVTPADSAASRQRGTSAVTRSDEIGEETT